MNERVKLNYAGLTCCEPARFTVLVVREVAVLRGGMYSLGPIDAIALIE